MLLGLYNASPFPYLSGYDLLLYLVLNIGNGVATSIYVRRVGGNAYYYTKQIGREQVGTDHLVVANNMAVVITPRVWGWEGFQEHLV